MKANEKEDEDKGVKEKEKYFESLQMAKFFFWIISQYFYFSNQRTKYKGQYIINKSLEKLSYFFIKCNSNISIYKSFLFCFIFVSLIKLKMKKDIN